MQSNFKEGGENMGEMNIEDLVNRIEVTLADAKKNIVDNGGFDKGDFRDIYETMILVAAIAVEAGEEFAHLTLDERKQAIAKAINKMVNIPLVPENLEEHLFKFVTGLLITAWEDKKSRMKLAADS